MCCNRNNNVAGVSGRRCNQNNVAGNSGCRCNQNNVGGTGGGCNQNNVGGTGGRCRCECSCRCVPREPQVIAVRGPGCIDGTGRCNRFANESVRSDRGFDSFCGQVSPSGNTQRNSDRRRGGCRCFDSFFDELMENLSENSNGCPR